MKQIYSQPKVPHSSAIDRLYDDGYYHGQTSGYHKQGYALHHPDWAAWLDLVELVQPAGTALDLGSAYGYLVQEAGKRGYRAFGADISSYALRQERDLVGRLVQADLTRLPFRRGCADVVFLFDVLEHLHDPLPALREAERALAPEGVLVGTTPDPLFFERDEPTHFFERPPSFWIAALEDLGLSIRFRFSVEAYNFQFFAARRGSAMANKISFFGHDHVDGRPDFATCEGPLQLLPRCGWSELSDGGRTIRGDAASIYVFNPDFSPWRLRVALRLRHSPDFSTLRIRFDSQIVAEVALTTERTEHRIELPEIFVPRGGHHLFFDLLPGGPEVEVSHLVAGGSPASSGQLTLGLPFDLFQRYRLAGRLLEILGAESVLDVGGLLGDRDGHLATSADFLGDPKRRRSVRSTDLRHADLPEHSPALAWEQPFSDGAFDLVASLDVLEHLPPERRTEFLAELDRLCRRWIILAAPFSTPAVEAAERSLSEGLVAARRFLQEHREMGLPKAGEIERFFRQRGRVVHQIPNGFLPRWTAMQTLTLLYFSFGDPVLFRAFNQAYNEKWHTQDQNTPAYRIFWIIGKEPLSPSREAALRELSSERPQDPLEELFQDPTFLGLQDRVLEGQRGREEELRALQFLLNERQKLIGHLGDEIHHLRGELENTPLWVLAKRRLRKKYGK